MNTIPSAIETNPLNQLPGRLWSDLAVPCERLKPARYADWLAMHLAGPASPALSPIDQAYDPSWDAADAADAVQRLADISGRAHHGLLRVEELFACGMDYAGHLGSERAIWRQMAPEDRRGMTFAEWSIGEPVWNRLLGEWKVRNAIGNVPALPDVPFRPLLRRLLGNVSDQRARAACLAGYLFSFAERSGAPLPAQFLK